MIRKHVVVIGTSFIGMEVAAALIDHAASVTVIGRDRVPFQVRVLIHISIIYARILPFYNEIL